MWQSTADLQKQGLLCFYDNAQLMAWVDIMFLCCLPLHEPSFCFVVQPATQKHCTEYSLVTAVPLLRTLPLFDLTAAQLRESPFSQQLEKSELVLCHLALLCWASTREWPTKQHGFISTKTSLTSAVVGLHVRLDDKSPFSTPASNIFSEIPEETTD
ncbi:LOW QUALITY PROTEIN: NADP-dependent oxidoreductase domain-containing protein 1 [Porphyrio hochstetteri]